MPFRWQRAKGLWDKFSMNSLCWQDSFDLLRTLLLLLYVTKGWYLIVLTTTVAIWVYIIVWLWHSDISDVVLWLCSGFYLKKTKRSLETPHTNMSRMNSDQSPCASLAKAALNPNQECGGLDYVTDMCDICFYISEVCFLVFEWCTRICSGNMSAHDIMVCNEK